MVTINTSVDATSFVISLSLSLVWSVGIVGVLEVPERPLAQERPITGERIVYVKPLTGEPKAKRQEIERVVATGQYL